MMRFARLALCLVVLLAASGCSGLFYFPSRRLQGWPNPRYRFEEVAIPTTDGLTLHGWLFAAHGGRRGTMVQFHGNAGNVTTHYESLVWLAEHGYSLLTFDYRGYGRSPGQPSQAGLELDALAAIRYAQSLPLAELPAAEEAGDANDLVLYGQSLGGALLVRAYGALVDRRRVRALVVEGSFHSYEEQAASVCFRHPLLFPFAGLAYAAVSDEYAPSGFVERVAPTPLLIVHGARDPVVPVAFGYALYHQARSPRALWIVPDGGHGDAMRRARYRRALVAFLERPTTARSLDQSLRKAQ